MYKDKQNL